LRSPLACCRGDGGLRIAQQSGLVAHHRQRVIAIASDNGLCHRPMAMQRIGGDHATLQRQQTDKLQSRRRWPAGTEGQLGGEFRPKDGSDAVLTQQIKNRITRRELRVNLVAALHIGLEALANIIPVLTSRPTWRWWPLSLGRFPNTDNWPSMPLRARFCQGWAT
jgi:hypothetical protein